MDNATFIQNMPKIELHAHLNGSLCTKSIEELGEPLYGANTKEFLALSKQLNNLGKLDEYFLKFRFMHEITSTKRGLQLATELVIRDFARDNVIYLELRTTPKANAEMTKLEYMKCVLDAIEDAKKVTKMRVHLLPSIDRRHSVAEAEDTVEIALQLRNAYKGIIVGIDFGGNPKLGEFEQFMPVLQRARQHNLKLALHCGEIDNPLEIKKIVEFGMERCGHGTFLSEHQLMELGKKGVAIECCLTSNVKCATVESYDDHHFKRIFDAKMVPVVICTDDCGVFETTLSREFELAQQTFNLKNYDLLLLALNAVEHAFTEEDTKHELRQTIQNYFKVEN